MHITRDMCCEHISLVVLCVYWVKEQILLRICVSQLLGTHITSDMCSQGSGTNIYSDMCFLGRGTHITRDMCSLGRRTHITSDMCFKGRGTYITKDMCSPGRGTDITRDTCFQGREHMSLVIWVSRVGERISLAIWVKTRSSKSRKIGIFPKSLVHGFDKNWQFFHFYILGKIGQENVFHDILERKKRGLCGL